MSEVKGKGVLTSFHLKLIAILSMTIDHVGAALFPNANIGSFEYMRVLGRLAFPIFCFLIVEGFFYTRNIKKYLVRLFLFAFISELPFDLLFNRTGNLWAMQNIFFTLFLGLIAIYAIDVTRIKRGQNTFAITSILVAVGVVAHFANVDYAELGIIYIVTFYLYRGRNLQIFLILVVLNLLFCGANNIQMFSALAVPIIACYNGKLGPKVKYLFYAYYPLHLAMITGIYVWLYGHMPTEYFTW